MKEFTWTEEKIRLAFDRFFEESNRFPTCDDMDACSYLPTVRTLQRRFGGAKGWRAKLGLEIVDYASGAARSITSKAIGARGHDSEIELAMLLINLFGEVFVHQQKPFGNGLGRLDFYVYTQNYEFGIDVFYPATYRNLAKCLRLKAQTYEKMNRDLVLLSANLNLSQEGINKCVTNRRHKLNSNIRVLSKPTFDTFLSELIPYNFKLNTPSS